MGVKVSCRAAVALLCAGVASAQAGEPANTPAAPSSVMLLQTTTTGDGQPLVYPGGTAQIISRITTFPPGSKTGLHRHPMPLYAYILEGQLTIQAEGQPPRHFKAGDAFMEVAQWHYGINPGTTPTRLLAVYAGAVDLPLSESKPKGAGK